MRSTFVNVIKPVPKIYYGKGKTKSLWQKGQEELRGSNSISQKEPRTKNKEPTTDAKHHALRALVNISPSLIRRLCSANLILIHNSSFDTDSSHYSLAQSALPARSALEPRTKN